jgi:hypothetical protein
LQVLDATNIMQYKAANYSSWKFDKGKMHLIGEEEDYQLDDIDFIMQRTYSVVREFVEEC